MRTQPGDEILRPDLLETLKTALARVPIHFLGVHEIARLEKAYYTGIPDVYSVFISYGVYALHGVMFLGLPDITFLMDYSSVVTVLNAYHDMIQGDIMRRTDPRTRGY